MRYKEAQPCDALRQIVRYFWCIDQEETDLGPSRYLLLAESSPSLVFFHSDKSCLLAGQTGSFRQMLIAGKFSMMGACLYPHAIPLLFRMPASELTNAAFNFNDVAGYEAQQLNEKLNDVASFQERIHLLSNYFLSKISAVVVEKRSVHGCVLEIIKTGGRGEVSDFANQLGISVRQAERKFHESVGFSPKLFTRLIRFHSCLKFSGKGYSLSEIAYLSGYFDQSHFIRDFKQFSGLKPGQYFRLNPTQVSDNFIRLPD
jgi:AraC-like DNA-binding protein